MAHDAEKDSWGNHADYPETRFERHFGDRVIRCFVQRPQSVYSLFSSGLAANSDGDAIVYETQKISFRELNERIATTAGALRNAGVRNGTRVAILLGNCPEYVILFFAIAKLGAIAVPLNVRETASELQFILDDCGAEYIIHSSHLADRVPEWTSAPSLTRISIDPDQRNLQVVLGDGTPLHEAEPVDEDDTAVVLYTSGTTGRPKGAQLTHLNIVHSVLHYHYAMRMAPTDRSLIAVPMSHVTGLVALVALAAHAGATLIVMRQFSASAFIELAEIERMTHTLLVPAMFALCLLQPDIQTRDLKDWRISGYGGAIMPEATLQTIAKVLPNLQLINCYGATETTSPAVMMPPSLVTERASEVGLPVICADIRLMDETGIEVPVGIAGEVWIDGPMVVPKYWNNPEATAKEFVGAYWRSGDIGVKDEHGFIQIIDRLKDVINRGGYKIYASEVENHLLTHDFVEQAAVVGKACPVLGERVAAFLVVKDGCTVEDLAAHCRDHLADYKNPEEFRFVADLPRNANGKVLKRDLKTQFKA